MRRRPNSTSAGSKTQVGLPRISSRLGLTTPASSHRLTVVGLTPTSSANRRRVSFAPKIALTASPPRCAALTRGSIRSRRGSDFCATAVRYSRLTPVHGGPRVSTKRDKAKRRRRAAWEVAKRRELTHVREQIGLGPDATIPDEVLLAEVDGYIPVDTGTWEPNYFLEPRRQWFGFRLIGLADREDERSALSRRLSTIRSGRMLLALAPARCPAGRRAPDDPDAGADSACIRSSFRYYC